MAVFNVAFLNPKSRTSGGSSAGILSDQLTILQNELGKDGYMSAGDYDILIDKARELRSSAGLSTAQRSDYDVKISNFEKAKSVVEIDRTEDINKINRSLKSESAEDVMVAGNNPQEFLNGRIASLQAKLNDLSEIIERRNAAGSDTTEYYNEYQSTLSDYSDRLSALASLSEYNGNDPIIGYVAYVTTNDKGEITDVDYGRYGSKTGYAETNGTIDGLQVYGKVNFKNDGKNYFLLGDNIFSAVDMLVQDPNNPGSYTTNRLVAGSQKKGAYTVGKSGYLNINSSSLKIQSYIPTDSWAKGVGGTIYKRRSDGGYSKYLNVSEPLDGMPDVNNMLTLPASYEQSLMRNVDETIDASEPIMPDEGLSRPAGDVSLLSQGPTQALAPNYGAPDFSGMTSPLSRTGTPQATNQTQQTSGVPLRKTAKQPVQEASSGIGATAQRTIKSGVDFFKGLFNR